VITEKSRIKVEPISDPGADVPNWVGEEIPVPYEVSQEVGSIRKRLMEQVRRGMSADSIIEACMRNYPADKEAASAILELVKKQVNKGLTVPADDVVVIEQDGTSIIINVCGGHR